MTEQTSLPIHSASHIDVPYSRPTTPGASPPQIGFLGLGAMGYPMAKNLATHRHSHPEGGPPLLVYNRTRGKSEQLLKQLGPNRVRIADKVEDLARDCDVIITSLANDQAVKDIYAQFRAALLEIKHDRPKIFVETSTILPAVAGELDQLLSGIDHTHFITCPVVGPPAVAERAGLILIMAGNYRSKKEVAYLLVPSVGRKVIDLGGNIVKAPTLKLLANSLIMGSLEVMAESLTMGEKAGIEAEVVLGVIKEMFPQTFMIPYGLKMIHDQFDGLTGFAIDGGLKDASHIRRLTSELNAPMPVIDIAHQHLLTARAIFEEQKAHDVQKFEVLDWSALIAGPRVAAGLDGLDSGKHIKVEKEE